MTDDEKHFGKDCWVYCGSHLAPHTTGWCTVSVKDKVALQSDNRKDAVEECKQKGYTLYHP